MQNIILEQEWWNNVINTNMHHMNKDNEICILNWGQEYQDPHLKSCKPTIANRKCIWLMLLCFLWKSFSSVCYSRKCKLMEYVFCGQLKISPIEWKLFSTFLDYKIFFRILLIKKKNIFQNIKYSTNHQN